MPLVTVGGSVQTPYLARARNPERLLRVLLGCHAAALPAAHVALSARLPRRPSAAAAQQDARAVHAMGERALAQKPKPSFAKLNPEWEGCCMGNKQTCKCGAPFFS